MGPRDVVGWGDGVCAEVVVEKKTMFWRQSSSFFFFAPHGSGLAGNSRPFVSKT